MTNGPDFERCWATVGRIFGDVRPACTVEVVGLTDPRMQIEIEVTALRRKEAAKAKPKARAKTASKNAKRKK
jgi:hypothetical protein